MTAEQIKKTKEWYCNGVTIKLISMDREPQMPPGLTGKVSYVDDAGQIHVSWNNGSTLALVCGVDEFIAINGPIARKYLSDKLCPETHQNIWYRNNLNKHTVDVIETIDFEKLVVLAECYIKNNITMTQELAAKMCKPYETENLLEEFLSSFVLSDEAVREIKHKKEFTKDESQASSCPKCGSIDLDYGMLETLDSCIEYPWTCNNCGSKGKEYANLIFDGHIVDASPYFKIEETLHEEDLTIPAKPKVLKIIVPYVSVWDGGVEVESKALVDIKSGEVTDIEPVNVHGLEICEREYIVMNDEQVDVFTDEHGYDYWVDLSGNEELYKKLKNDIKSYVTNILRAYSKSF